MNLCVTGKLAANTEASGAHLDLFRAPYALYAFKYIDLVSLAPFPGHERCPHQVRAAGGWPDLGVTLCLVFRLRYVY